MSTRSERRAERQRQREAAFDQFEQEILATQAQAAQEPDDRRPLMRSIRFWIPVGVLLAAAAVAGVVVAQGLG